MDLETTENFSISWNPKAPYLIGIGFSHGNARYWYLPLENPIIKWDAADLKTRWRHLVYPNSSNSQETDKKASIPSTDWNHDGNLLATASRSGVVKIWTSEGVFFRNLEGHTGHIVGLNFSPNGSKLFTIGIDRKVIVWETSTGKQIQVYYIRKVIDYHWFNDEIFAVTAENGILILRVGEQKPMREIQTTDVNTIRFDRAETACLAAGYDNSKVIIWQMNKSDPVTIFNGHKREVHTLRWSPKGQQIASIDYDNHIIVWKAFTAEIILNFTHSETLNSISFSPNGQCIAATAYDGRIFVWNIESKIQIFNTSYKVQFYEIAWNCTGEWIAVAAPGYIAIADLRQAIKAGQEQQMKITK
uniref:Translation initiation factor beta propellor-like domain-containing protein n=1 Tax=Panagrolaimus sp. ES5 TaxID=591445 RepID=A0AC34FPT8_9BILA